MLYYCILQRVVLNGSVCGCFPFGLRCLAQSELQDDDRDCRRGDVISLFRNNNREEGLSKTLKEGWNRIC